jgi:amino acid adenylation domain-containing protein
VTGFEVLTAAWRLWLWGCTGARDVVMGTVHAGRDHPALADQIGLYVNTIPLRIQLNPRSSFLELIDTVRQQAVAAFDHAELPFNKIVEHLQLPREGSGNPLFEVFIAHDDLFDIETTLTRSGWTAEEVELPVSPFELILTGSEDSAGMELRLQYRTALWDENQIGLWLQEIESLLERVCSQPHRPLDSLVLPEKLLIPRATQSVVQHFEQWRHRQPQAPCVLGDTIRSYQDVGAAADALSCRLIHAGTVPQEVVAVLVERCWDLPVSVIGIMKARAVFVLLDPAHPIERLAFIVRDAGCRSVVYSDGFSDLAKSLGASFSELNQGLAISPEPLKMLTVHQAGTELFDVPSDLSMCRDDLAYLIYTSGSTGEPKGVLVDHGALSDHLAGITPLSLWTSVDRSLLFATVAVDAVIEQLLLPLVNGASFCILDSERYSPKAFVETWQYWGASIIDVPPVFWGDLINWCIKNPIGIEKLAIKTLMTGGEEMTPQRVKGWYDLPFYCGQILNLFGPTETTCSPIVARIAPHHTSRNRIPIGFPVGGRRIRILNGEGQEVSVGEQGELLIGSESVAQGYLNKPALTAERFVTDENSTRWYRTGDLVKQRLDGELEYIGRIDRQFKLRGFRIEPGEIEETLRRCEGVQDAAVTFETNDEGGELLAWLVILPGLAPTRSGILRHLSESMPSHMIPKRFKCIDHLPLSRTEKLDRKALLQMKAYDLWDDKADSKNKESANSLEKFCQIIAAVVDVPSVDASDNFFTVGGHSLKAIELVARVREHFGVEIRIKDVFNAATVADLYETTRALKHLVAQPIKPVSRDLPLPASAGQTRLWLLQSQNPGSVAFNMVAGFVIDDQLNLMALQAAYHGLLVRHEVLRTHLVMKAGQLTQVIQTSIESAPILVEQLDSMSMSVRTPIQTDEDSVLPNDLDRVHRELDVHLNRIFNDELNRPFNLASEAPIRLRLIQCAVGFGLIINIHHASFDGWSATVMLDDLAALYRTACKGEDEQNMAMAGVTIDGTLKPLSIQYADYSSWQQSFIPSSHREFWLAQFEEETLPQLRLPVDHPRPDKPSGQGAIVTGTFSQSSAQKLRDLAIQEDVTLFGVLLTLTVVHLYVQSGQTDFIVGTAVAGRDYPELEGQIGFYVNMLPLRCHINPAQPFNQQVRQFGQLARQALLHQDYPFDALVYEVDHKPSAGRQPFFDVVLNMQNFKPMQLVLEGTKTRLLEDRSVSSKYDLMYMIDDLDSLDLYLEYASDLFEPLTAQTMADEFLSIAAACAMEPSQKINVLLMPWRKKITTQKTALEIPILKQSDW